LTAHFDDTDQWKPENLQREWLATLKFVFSLNAKIANTIMKTISVAVTALMLSIFAHSATAGNPEVGRELANARLCVGCHGKDGVSVKPYYPNLAGQNETYLTKMLTDFREKKRHDQTMNAMAVKLTDEDIANLAAFFSSLPR
jgi:cytochrome c553